MSFKTIGTVAGSTLAAAALVGGVAAIQTAHQPAPAQVQLVQPAGATSSVTTTTDTTATTATVTPTDTTTTSAAPVASTSTTSTPASTTTTTKAATVSTQPGSEPLPTPVAPGNIDTHGKVIGGVTEQPTPPAPAAPQQSATGTATVG